MTTLQTWNSLSAHLLNFIKQQVAVKEDAEDILQDVFIRIHQGIHSLRDEDKLAPWVFRIARNAIHDFRKNRTTSSELADNSSIPLEDEALPLLMAECMEPMIKRLPEKYSKPLLLSEIEGIRQQDVAERLGIGLSAAKSRIQRGRKLLRQQFIDCCNFQLNGKGQIKAGFQEQACKLC